MQLEVEVFGEKVLSRRLLRYAQRAGNARPAFRRIAVRLRKAAALQFASQGAYGSGGWEPLKVGTRAAKARRGLDPRILQATHALRDSLITSASGDHVEEIADDELRWGSRNPVGKFHQRGTVNMPARPPFELPERERRAIVRELHVHVVGEGEAA